MPTHPTWKRKSHIRRIHQIPFRKKQPNFAEYLLAYPPIEASWTIATTTYPFLSAEVQRVIAIYTSTDDLKGFLLRFIGEEILKFYGTFASDIIRRSIIEFACTCFHYYFRHKTGSLYITMTGLPQLNIASARDPPGSLISLYVNSILSDVVLLESFIFSNFCIVVKP
ncbi:hypothetical protein Ao3042_11306 [Aspergillus oryzae 3.042]|uniref:Uncharacterized protein n=1 Tax=Aspergillus oryzae (strain 3.042) TaxID=1160506 RepID=I8IVB3_ASPO3|nr:hypothetical protein Ao3042_11306 [Aspergillus oryzae 3.042]|eukprot:EIT83421.1 hypothetical protein Ao3042_11306 [Aspergillus oryzae 3.042]